jgi:phosphocarrier protein
MEASEKSPSSTTTERTLTVQNKMGIHARPAAMIVRVTNRFKSEVFFEKDEEQVNGKSIMGLMMLAAGRGSVIRVSAQGEDADELLNDLEELFERRFDEG